MSEIIYNKLIDLMKEHRTDMPLNFNRISGSDGIELFASKEIDSDNLNEKLNDPIYKYKKAIKDALTDSFMNDLNYKDFLKLSTILSEASSDIEPSPVVLKGSGVLNTAARIFIEKNRIDQIPKSNPCYNRLVSLVEKIPDIDVFIEKIGSEITNTASQLEYTIKLVDRLNDNVEDQFKSVLLEFVNVFNNRIYEEGVSHRRYLKSNIESIKENITKAFNLKFNPDEEPHIELNLNSSNSISENYTEDGKIKKKEYSLKSERIFKYTYNKNILIPIKNQQNEWVPGLLNLTRVQFRFKFTVRKNNKIIYDLGVIPINIYDIAWSNNNHETQIVDPYIIEKCEKGNCDIFNNNQYSALNDIKIKPFRIWNLRGYVEHDINKMVYEDTVFPWESVKYEKRFKRNIVFAALASYHKSPIEIDIIIFDMNKLIEYSNSFMLDLFKGDVNKLVDSKPAIDNMYVKSDINGIDFQFKERIFHGRVDNVNNEILNHGLINKLNQISSILEAHEVQYKNLDRLEAALFFLNLRLFANLVIDTMNCIRT